MSLQGHDKSPTVGVLSHAPPAASHAPGNGMEGVQPGKGEAPGGLAFHRSTSSVTAREREPVRALDLMRYLSMEQGK
jgi:hypothetical protein